MAQYVDLTKASVVRRVLRAARTLLSSHKQTGLQGFAVGYKVTAGVRTNYLALIMLVDHKPAAGDQPVRSPLVTASVMDAGQFLQDDAFSGQSLLLDVQSVGALVPHLDPDANSLRTQLRPAYAGASTAHIAFPGTGSIGAALRDSTGGMYILSNNHVLALETGYRDGQRVGFRSQTANIGDMIVQPGDEAPRAPEASDVFASLAAFLPLYYDGAAAAAQENFADAALAKVLDPGSMAALIPLLGPQGTPIDVSGFGASVNVNDVVYKVGRTTGATKGTVQQVNVVATLPYDAGYATFSRLCITSMMSQPGDSGSLIVGADGLARGLLIGGSDQVSIFCDVIEAISSFGQTLNTALSLV